METIRAVYTGKLRTTATHLRSGNEIITDAPVDNKGKGEAFSPTDLLAASLGTCMVTTMAIVAENNGFNIDNTIIRITKIMASEPRRVSEIHVELDMPSSDYSEKNKEALYNAAVKCPVARSIHPDIIQNVKFNYP